jgi:hypothetical protein
VDYDILLEIMNEILGKTIMMPKIFIDVKNIKLMKMGQITNGGHAQNYILCNFMTCIIFNSKAMTLIK